MKLALIGNCAYQALVDAQASVVWLCWPRFDSSFVFGSLLDSEKGGHFKIQPEEAAFEVNQAYVPNTNVLRTVFTSNSGSFEVLDFAPRFRQYDRYYKPTLLMRRVRPLSGQPRVRVDVQPTAEYGKHAPAATPASNHISWRYPDAELRLTTNAPLTYIENKRAFVLEEEVDFALTWGEPLEAPLLETANRFYLMTCAYWERWVKHTSLPGAFQKETIRSALALKLHQFEDTGAITAASTTSLPEEHGAGRNWDYRFCWLRDSYFTLRAMRRLGHFEEMEGYVAFIQNIAESQPERLQPVFSIGGQSKLHEIVLDHLAGYMGNQPVRAGNAAYYQVQNDAYGEVIAAIAPLALDPRFSMAKRQENVVRLVTRLLKRIDETMTEPDAGIWEYRGRERVHTFSLLFHWAGAKIAQRIGETIRNPELAAEGERLAARARDVIENECYDAQLGFYGDSTTTNNPDAALFMMVNLGYLDPKEPKTQRHVSELATRLKQQGGLVQRYQHEDDFGQSLSTFTVCGFWYAEALARLGEKELATEACRQLVGYSNHVGLFSEDLDPSTGEMLGNFPQTYSHVGLINAAFAIAAQPEEIANF